MLTKLSKEEELQDEVEEEEEEEATGTNLWERQDLAVWKSAEEEWNVGEAGAAPSSACLSAERTTGHICDSAFGCMSKMSLVMTCTLQGSKA